MIIEFWKTNENPITCYSSRGNDFNQRDLKKNPKTVPKKKAFNNMKPVTVEYPDGKIQDYESVALAADALGINHHTLYAFLNGHAKNPTECKIYKSILNK